MNRQPLLLAVTIIGVGVATVWLHWPSLGNGLIHGDDNVVLEELQQQPRFSWGSVKWAFTTTHPYSYFPITRMLYLVEYQRFTFRPLGYHATSIALHGLNCALVTLLAWLLLSRGVQMSDAERLATAGGVGLVFGFHPLQVEPVAWFTQQMTLLCALFSLGSLCAYVRWAHKPENNRWQIVVAILFGAALLSKSVAVSLPLVMLVMDVCPLRRHDKAGWRRLVTEKALLFTMSAATAAGMMAAANRGNAVVGVAMMGLGERLLVAVRAITFYLWKVVWPAWLSPYYPLFPLRAPISLWQREYFTAVTVVVGITVLCLWKRNRAPALLAAWLAFLALILPMSGLVQIGPQAAADRYMYLAMLPLVLLVAWGCMWLWRQMGTVGRTALVVLVGCDLLYFTVRAREQIAVWRDDETVSRAVLRPFPDCGLANLQLALTLAEQRRFDEALVYAERAVQSDPAFARNHSTLGLIYLKTHRYGEAASALQEAARLDPKLPAARYNLACAYSRLGQFEQAYATLRELITLQPQAAQVAVRDAELSGLRNDPAYVDRMRVLLATGGPEQ